MTERRAPAVKLISDVIVEPVTLAECRMQLRLTPDQGSPPSHHDDEWIRTLGLPAAREKCEAYCAQSFGQKTLEMALDAFPSALFSGDQYRFACCAPSRWAESGTVPLEVSQIGVQLPFGPVDRVVSVKYLNPAGALQTLSPAAYTVDSYQNPAWLLLAPDESWPSTQSVANAVKIRYAVGYSLPDDSPLDKPLPKSVKIAILLTLGHLFENRENTTDLKLIDLPQGAATFLEPYNLRLGFA